jgi:hypothetical protein
MLQLMAEAEAPAGKINVSRSSPGKQNGLLDVDSNTFKVFFCFFI